MPPPYSSVEDLHHDIQNNIVNKFDVFKQLSPEFKCKYSALLNKLRQQNYRARNKDTANLRSRLSMAKARSNNPDKYKELNKSYNQVYKNNLATRKNNFDFVSNLLHDIIHQAIDPTPIKSSTKSSNKSNKKSNKSSKKSK